MVAYGVSCGWPSPSNQILMSDASPLPTGSITMNEASSVAAFSYPGGLVGNFVAGFITKNFGRKIPLLLLAIPTIVNNFNSYDRFEVSAVFIIKNIMDYLIRSRIARNLQKKLFSFD